MLAYDLDLPDITNLLASWGEPAYRAKQIWEGLYRHFYNSPSQFSNLPKSLREKMAGELDFVGIQPVRYLDSSDGQTRKT
ncbi:MAG TPA: 23S rRNA (adenine(2503)-C2)-methyltransferase, partial [Anaerolineales bacterium]|nr:23S rRNA (adenine(2503)-C2)-methyltransferase [Anaerolineales bacterium]